MSPLCVADQDLPGSPEEGDRSCVSGGAALERLTAAQQARLQRLVVAHIDVIWRALRRLGVPRDAADDAAQQVFVQLATNVDAIDPGKERSYAYSVAVRVAANVRRALATASHRFADEDLTRVSSRERDPERALAEERARQQLDAILESMHPERRTVFVLFELEGLEGPDIAEALGLPPGTVASRLRRAREEFRAAVARIERSRGGGHTT